MQSSKISIMICLLFPVSTYLIIMLGGFEYSHMEYENWWQLLSYMCAKLLPLIIVGSASISLIASGVILESRKLFYVRSKKSDIYWVYVGVMPIVLLFVFVVTS